MKKFQPWARIESDLDTYTNQVYYMCTYEIICGRENTICLGAETLDAARQEVRILLGLPESAITNG